MRPDIRPPIGQALASDPLKGFVGAIRVGLGAGVIAEVKLAQIAGQVLLGAMLIDATHPALED